MLRRRGRASLVRGTSRPLLAVVAAVVLVLAAAGCGRNDFKNDPRPPVPQEVAVKIATDGVGVSPKTFGAGLAMFTVANLTNQAGSLTIHGPVSAQTDSIPPAGTGSVKVNLTSGTYEASVDGFVVKPFRFTVGPERASAQNDLLLP